MEAVELLLFSPGASLVFGHLDWRGLIGIRHEALRRFNRWANGRIRLLLSQGAAGQRGQGDKREGEETLHQSDSKLGFCDCRHLQARDRFSASPQTNSPQSEKTKNRSKSVLSTALLPTGRRITGNSRWQAELRLVASLFPQQSDAWAL